jgi:hypothetical protein
MYAVLLVKPVTIAEVELETPSAKTVHEVPELDEYSMA